MPKDKGLIGVRLPGDIMKFIDDEVETGAYLSRSEWVRMACYEYWQKRKRDRQGGGLN